MNKKLLENGWKQKLIRIKNDYNILVNFLIYSEMIRNGTEEKVIFNNIFLESLNYMYDNGFHYNIIKYEGRREPKGFLVSDSTFTRIEDSFNLYKTLYYHKNLQKLSMGEFIELLMFIYCNNFMEKDDYEFIKGKIDWGIIDIKQV